MAKQPGYFDSQAAAAAALNSLAKISQHLLQR